MTLGLSFDVTQLRAEIALFCLISGSITILLTITDIVIFDNYVLPIMSECHSTNDSSFCNEMRNKLGVPLGQQLEIGSKYWDILISHFYFLAGIMSFIRIVTPTIFKPKPTSGSKWKKIYFIMGGIWFVGIVIWFMFGALDTGYYFLRGMEIPENLNWLNDAGLFVLVKNLSGSEDVEKNELYILNILGASIFISMWLIIYFVKKKYASKLKLF